MMGNSKSVVTSLAASAKGGQSFEIASSTLPFMKAEPRTSPPKELWIWSLGPSELA